MNPSSAGSRIGAAAVALSTAVVLIAISIVPFLTPAWVEFEQGRTGAAELTGFTGPQVRSASQSILADLVLGPPAFDVEIDGVAVLTEPERAHMRDVRGVFAAFYAAAAVGLAILGAAFWLAGRRRASIWTPRAAWRAVRLGALGLAAGIAITGVIAFVAFDAAFAVFHQLFFSGGNYLFDPRTSRLVQLFPDALWFETSVVVGGVILVLALATTWLAGRRARSSTLAAAIDGQPTAQDRDPATLTTTDPEGAR